MGNLSHLRERLATTSMNTSFDPLPAGIYTVNIIGADMKETKLGDGEFIEVTLEVASGPHTGRRIWDRLNVVNKNPVTQDIATKALNTLSALCGIADLDDTSELLGHQVPVKLDMKPRKDDPTTLENRVIYQPPKAPANTQPRPAAPKSYAAPQQAVAAAASSTAPSWRTRTTAVA